MPKRKTFLQEAYRVRSPSELDRLSAELNGHKNRLRAAVRVYRDNYTDLISPPVRLCRALAVPGWLGEQARRADKSRRYAGSPQGVVEVTSSIWHILKRNMGMDTSSDEKNTAVLRDVNELGVYLRMYSDIRYAMAKPEFLKDFPYGNPFKQVLGMMFVGGVIVRFKYVSTDFSLPQEKIVSYHPMSFGGKAVLGVHVEGDGNFSMWKRWGEGDETMRPLHGKYTDRIVRWGKEDVFSALIRKDGRKQFLY